MTSQAGTNVFTYGSLMYPQVIGKLVKKSYAFEKAVLRNYERRHVKERVYPGVTKCQGKQVTGILYYGVNEEDLAALDYFESQEYARVQVTVQTFQHKNTVNAIVYQYIDTKNLQAEEWRIEDFQKLHKHSFADSHLQVKANSQGITIDYQQKQKIQIKVNNDLKQK